MAEKRKGTRCKVCTFCGACFKDDKTEGWSGKRCDVCRGCGKCLQAWGLFGADTESGATSWADAFKGMDDGSAPPPPAVPAAPGASAPGRSAEVLDGAGADRRAGAGAGERAGANADGHAADADERADASDQGSAGQTTRARSPFATLKAQGDEVDTSTGATPGVSSACKEYGMGDSFEFAARLGIKPPGQS